MKQGVGRRKRGLERGATRKDGRHHRPAGTRSCLAEKSLGSRATRRRSIEPGRIQALRKIVIGSGPDGLVATDPPLSRNANRHSRPFAFSRHRKADAQSWSTIEPIPRNCRPLLESAVKELIQRGRQLLQECGSVKALWVGTKITIR